jgi:hypothetical protein
MGEMEEVFSLLNTFGRLAFSFRYLFCGVFGLFRVVCSKFVVASLNLTDGRNGCKVGQSTIDHLPTQILLGDGLPGASFLPSLPQKWHDKNGK